MNTGEQLLAKAEVDHQSILHAEEDHKKVVLVDWMLGNSCNHACSYCPAELHDGSIKWQTSDNILTMYETLHRHYVESLGRSVWLQFTGGEPTQHPKIVALLNAAHDFGFRVSLISNGSRTVRFWQKICQHMDAAILTYHDEFVSHEHFVEIASLLVQSMPVQANITMHPDRFEAILATAIRLSKQVPTMTIVMKPLREGFKTKLMDYTDSQISQFRTIHPTERPLPISVSNSTPRGVMRVDCRDGSEKTMRANQFIVKNENHWHGFRCEAGIESLRVKADGAVFRAVCGVGGRIGYFGEEIFLPVSSVRCDRETCSCVADILISKYRV